MGRRSLTEWVRKPGLISRFRRLLWMPGDPLESMIDSAMATYYADLFPRSLGTQQIADSPAGVTVFCFQCGTCHYMFVEEDRKGPYVRCPYGHTVRYNPETQTWDQ